MGLFKFHAVLLYKKLFYNLFYFSAKFSNRQTYNIIEISIYFFNEKASNTLNTVSTCLIKRLTCFNVSINFII